MELLRRGRSARPDGETTSRCTQQVFWCLETIDVHRRSADSRPWMTMTNHRLQKSRNCWGQLRNKDGRNRIGCRRDDACQPDHRLRVQRAMECALVRGCSSWGRLGDRSPGIAASRFKDAPGSSSSTQTTATLELGSRNAVGRIGVAS